MKYIVDGVEKTRTELNEMLLDPANDMRCFEIVSVESDKVYIQTFIYGSYY